MLTPEQSQLIDSMNNGKRLYQLPQRKRNRIRCIVRDGGRCQWPGCTATEGLTVHHLVPRCKGGSHRLHNLVTLCRAHHRLIHLEPGYHGEAVTA